MSTNTNVKSKTKNRMSKTECQKQRSCASSQKKRDPNLLLLPQAPNIDIAEKSCNVFSRDPTERYQFILFEPSIKSLVCGQIVITKPEGDWLPSSMVTKTLGQALRKGVLSLNTNSGKQLLAERLMKSLENQDGPISNLRLDFLKEPRQSQVTKRDQTPLKEEVKKNNIKRDMKSQPPKKKAAKHDNIFSKLREALSNIEGRQYRDPFVKSRDRVVLLLLYFTGMERNDLLHITANSLQTLLDGGKLILPCVKDKEGHIISATITKRMQKIAQKNLEHIER